MSIETEAIDILQGALILSDFLDQEERSQILRRINQLQRRHEDPRTFIAFVGEKKAGKSSLLKAITGVPLPTAVRECTAAVCLIQMGLDWHHLAQMDSGEKRSFEAIDDSKERKVLRLARRKDKEAAEHAVQQIDAAEQSHREAKARLEKQSATVEEIDAALQQAKASLQEQQENLPFLWDVWKNFGWIAPKVRQIQDNLEQSAQQIEQNQSKLQEAHIQREAQRLETERLAAIIPERWKEAKEAATISQADVREAKKGLQEIGRANKDKFHTELHQLIDVEAEAAAQVDILTPNAHIPVDVVLLDTPGFNTERPEHRRRAWEAIEERADICVLVSDIRQPMPETALKMLRRITPFCPFMHLALTKSDLALQESALLQENPQQEILEAQQVAKDRVQPYWDGEMNIWVVSAEGENKQISQKIFTEFWESIPSSAHNLKSKKLSIYAIGEFIDILDIHILIAQDELREFDSKTLTTVQAIFEEVETHSSKANALVQQLLSSMSDQLKTHLASIEQNWVHRIQACTTKSDIKLILDGLQAKMEQDMQTTSQRVEAALLQGCEKITQQLLNSEPTPIHFNQLLTAIPAPLPKGSTVHTATWTAAGGLAGAATGLLLSGSLTGTLLIALGTGGITTILLSPIAEGKTKASEAISTSISMAYEQMKTQLSTFQVPLEQECSRQLQEILQKRSEEKRTVQRQNQVRQIQRMQDIQQRLENAKFTFWPSNTPVDPVQST